MRIPHGGRCLGNDADHDADRQDEKGRNRKKEQQDEAGGGDAPCQRMVQRLFAHPDRRVDDQGDDGGFDAVQRGLHVTVMAEARRSCA